MRRSARFFLLALVLATMAPGTWWRSEVPPASFEDALLVTDLDPKSLGVTGDLELTGAWQLDHANPFFGGFSALSWLGNGRLLAASDRAMLLEFSLPDQVWAAARMRQAPIGPGVRGTDDLEALARDPATGTLWFSFESENLIERHDPDGTSHRVRPAAMADWPYNGGAESLARLADGRFLVLGENRLRDSGVVRPGLLFAGDPIEGAEPIAFGLAAPDGYRPVDAAQLPDGRVMVLLRQVNFGLPVRFATALMVVDPDEIVPGGVLSGAIVARLDAPALDENFEGLAVVPRGAEGAADLYLIADDNLSAFQQTLLVRLAWPVPQAR